LRLRELAQDGGDQVEELRKQGMPKRKAVGSRLLEPAGVWAEHGVVQRQESHKLYY